MACHLFTALLNANLSGNETELNNDLNHILLKTTSSTLAWAHTEHVWRKIFIGTDSWHARLRRQSINFIRFAVALVFSVSVCLHCTHKKRNVKILIQWTKITYSVSASLGPLMVVHCDTIVNYIITHYFSRECLFYLLSAFDYTQAQLLMCY